MIGYGERRRRRQPPGTVIPHAGSATGASLALVIAMIEPALLRPTVASPSGTIRPTPSGLSAKRPAVNLSAVTRWTHGEKRAAEAASGKPKVEHVLACADLLPRSSSRARLHPSMRPHSTRKAGSSTSWPSPYRRSSVVPGEVPPTKFPAVEPLAPDHTDRSGQSHETRDERSRSAETGVHVTPRVAFTMADMRSWKRDRSNRASRCY